MSSQRTKQTFSSDYNGPVIILVQCIDLNKNLGSWHPIRAAKFFSSNFAGITNIKSAGSKKIKISFDSILNGNLCLNSDILIAHGFTACIPSNLIFGIIKLEIDVSEEDFRDGVQSPFPIISFKRISVKKDDNIVPTRIVELKFLSPKLPRHISVYNMIFDVDPSIRSPVQCNRCLRYGHTQKFCRSDPRCSHCSGSKHSITDWPTINATDPICLFCKLPHVATDRSCQEWSAQKDIKKIMATENISYKDAIIFKKNKCYTSAFKYSDVVNNQLPKSDVLIHNNHLNEAKWPTFTLDIQDAISSSVENLASTNSYSVFTDIIHNTAKSAIPAKKVNLISHPPSLLWWNSSCSEAVKIDLYTSKIFAAQAA
ncbi:hypothetical protein ACI65C_001452 [Semiaphis heraclei]